MHTPHMHTQAHILTHTHTHTRMHNCTCAHIHTHARAHAHKHTHTQTNTHTHTNTPADAALNTTPIVQQRASLGSSEVHQNLNNASKEQKTRNVNRKQSAQNELPKKLEAGEVVYPFGFWGKVFAVTTFVLFIASSLFWIYQFAAPKSNDKRT